jgi:preprotein translocase subunit SecG
MYKVLLVIHVMTTIALIVIVLVQRSASDGMGLSGSSSSNNFMSGRTAANFATRTTAILALIFILTSLGLGVITARSHTASSSIVDKIQTLHENPAAPKPETTAPAAPQTAPLAPRPE